MTRYVRWVLFGIAVLAVTLAVRSDWFGFVADQARVAEYLNHHGVSGLAVVTVSGALYTSLGAPRQLLALALGYALGGVQGTALATLATTLGAAVCFFTARWLFRAPLLHFFSRRLGQFDALFNERTWLKILMVRLVPVGSNLATNLVAGCSGIRFLPFIAGSALGYLPQTVIFALAGTGIGQADISQVILSAVLFALASAAAAFLCHGQRNHTPAPVVSDQT